MSINNPILGWSYEGEPHCFTCTAKRLPGKNTMEETETDSLDHAGEVIETHPLRRDDVPPGTTCIACGWLMRECVYESAILLHDEICRLRRLLPTISMPRCFILSDAITRAENALFDPNSNLEHELRRLKNAHARVIAPRTRTDEELAAEEWNNRGEGPDE